MRAEAGLKPQDKGKTIFTNREPVPFIQRMAAFLFCMGFIGLFWVFLERNQRYGSSFGDKIWGLVLFLGIVFCVIIGALAVLGLPPFQSKRRN
jgi:hypothetical protein